MFCLATSITEMRLVMIKVWIEVSCLNIKAWSLLLLVSCIEAPEIALFVKTSNLGAPREFSLYIYTQYVLMGYKYLIKTLGRWILQCGALPLLCDEYVETFRISIHRTKARETPFVLIRMQNYVFFHKPTNFLWCFLSILYEVWGLLYELIGCGMNLLLISHFLA